MGSKRVKLLKIVYFPTSTRTLSSVRGPERGRGGLVSPQVPPPRGGREEGDHALGRRHGGRLRQGLEQLVPSRVKVRIILSNRIHKLNQVKISRTILPRDFQLYVGTGPETGLNQHKVGNMVK